MKIKVVCLAAGEGKRMKSALPKVLHEICGKTMLQWAVDAAHSVDECPILVVGHGRERIMQAFKNESVQFAVQEQQLGTGHAVIMAKDALTEDYTHVIVTCGDMPMIEAEDIQALCREAENCQAVVATAIVEDATGYGRMVKDARGNALRIVEHRDATEEQRRIREINLALYIFRRDALLEALANLNNNTAQGEYYLTDTIEYIARNKGEVHTLVMDPLKGMGVNDRMQLARAMEERRKIINRRHMQNGVTLIDPKATYIDADVTIENDVVIYPGNLLEKGAVVEQGSVLYAGNHIIGARIPKDSKIGPNEFIKAGENRL